MNWDRVDVFAEGLYLLYWPLPLLANIWGIAILVGRCVLFRVQPSFSFKKGCFNLPGLLRLPVRGIAKQEI